MHVLTATDVCGRIYTDSVRFEVDSSFIPQLGNDTLICEDELLIYDLAGFDQVQWLPASAVSCDTCLQTVVIADTNLNLVALTNVNGCIDADTVNISVQALKKEMKTSPSAAGTVYFSPDLSLNPAVTNTAPAFATHLSPSISPSLPRILSCCPAKPSARAIQPSSWASGGKRRSILRSNSKPIRLR